MLRYRPIRDRDFKPRKFKYDALIGDIQREEEKFFIIREIWIFHQSKTSSGRNLVPGRPAVVASYDLYNNILA
jgi:hypothetical protein